MSYKTSQHDWFQQFKSEWYLFYFILLFFFEHLVVNWVNINICSSFLISKIVHGEKHLIDSEHVHKFIIESVFSTNPVQNVFLLIQIQYSIQYKYKFHVILL